MNTNKTEIKTADRSSNPSSTLSSSLPNENFLKIMLRYWQVILLTIVLFLVAEFIYLSRITPMYSSTARIYVEQNGPKIISEYEGVMAQSKNYLYTQVELIKSTSILSNVADDSQLKQLKSFENTDNRIACLKSILDVTVGKNNDIIEISCKSAYPQEAARIANAVVDSYVRYHSTSKRNTTAEVLKILEKEKVNRDKELTQKHEKILEFTRENGAISPDNSHGHIIFQDLAQLSVALNKAQLETINAKADLDAAQNLSNDSLAIKQLAMAVSDKDIHVSVNENEESRLRTELKYLEIELEKLRSQLTEEHPSIQLLHVKINGIKQELNTRIKTFADAYINVLRQKWVTAKQQEGELLAFFKTQQEIARKLDVKASEYSILQADLKRTERFCEILDNRIKELNITEDAGSLNISVLEMARPANKPFSPQKLRLIIVASILAIISGCFIALLCDWIDHRLKSDDEISAILDVPVFGAVPEMKKGQSIVEYGQKACFESQSFVAEACRAIRTMIFLGAQKTKAKTILVTSPNSGDGKSVFVSNLAITIAQAGQKTLILDADFRKPMQHKIFEVKNEMERGLSGVLAKTVILEKAIHTTSIKNLDLLTCGSNVVNPSELLNSDAFASLLKKLSQQYDRIIIDSPPVMPVADSQILGAMCDLTLLVLRANRSTKKTSQQAKYKLLNVGSNLPGVVVNCVTRRDNCHGYYTDYHNYSYNRNKED